MRLALLLPLAGAVAALLIRAALRIAAL